MATKTQNEGQAQANKNKSKGKALDTVNEQITDTSYQPASLIATVAAQDDTTVQTQASRLSDPRLPTLQRQMLAARIGERQGNQHLQQVLAAKSSESVSHPASKGSVSTPKTAIQAKLKVNEPDDHYEQEADQMAEMVMKLPASATPPPPDEEDTNAAPPQIQTKSDNDGVEISPDLENRIGQMQGQGQALPDSERSFFEKRMGADFSEVRVHTNGEAAQTAQDLQARAYTVGSDIAFNQGEYQPGSDEGRHLLAHELTHVMQQGEAGDLQRQPLPDIQRDEAADDLPTEEEKAEALAKAAEAKGEAGAAKEKGQAQKEKAQGEADAKKAEGEGPKQEAADSLSSGPVSKEGEAGRQAAVQDQAVAGQAAGEAQQATAVDAAQAVIDEAMNGPAAAMAEAMAENVAVPSEMPVGGGASEGTGAGPEDATPTATATVEAEFGAVEEAPDKAPETPEMDPAYQAVTEAGKAVGKEKQTHEPAGTKADAAQAAAESPASELARAGSSRPGR